MSSIPDFEAFAEKLRAVASCVEGITAGHPEHPLHEVFLKLSECADNIDEDCRRPRPEPALRNAG